MFELTDLVRQVPPWALWGEVGVGWIGLVAVVERLRMGRTPLLLTLFGASCLAFGAGGLALQALDPAIRAPVSRHAAP